MCPSATTDSRSVRRSSPNSRNASRRPSEKRSEPPIPRTWSRKFHPPILPSLQRSKGQAGLFRMTEPTTRLDQLKAALADRYRLEYMLREGGLATVYLAHDLKHGRRVALKVLKPEVTAALGPQRFLNEIQVTANLQHPHILPLYDSGNADGMLFYVMPLVRGESLRQRIEREQRAPVGEAITIARQVASALDFAHRQGVIHRDIKPENILLQEGDALLADFGIALALSEAAGGRLTGTGVSIGTIEYMSPEQAGGERDLDARSDVYALGAVTYEMLTGHPPVTGSTAVAIIANLPTEPPMQLRSVRGDVPRAVDASVMRALAKGPGDRFSSAREFADALTAPEPSATEGSGPSR